MLLNEVYDLGNLLVSPEEEVRILGVEVIQKAVGPAPQHSNISSQAPAGVSAILEAVAQPGKEVIE